MRSYVGNVEINAKATSFEMKANREGFIESTAVKELKAFARYAIDWATIYHDYYLREQLKEKSKIAKIEFEKAVKERTQYGQIVGSALNYIKKEVETVARALPYTERKLFEKSINPAFDAISTQDRSNKEELSHLRLIASTSTLLLIFSHEVKSLLGLLEQSKNSLEVIKNLLGGSDRDSVEDLRHDMDALKVRFEDLLNMTALIGIESRKAKPRQIALRERIINSEKAFQLVLNDYDIEVDYEQVPPNMVVKSMLEAEVYAIFLNTLSNAIKSVIAAGGARKIQILSDRKDGKTIIRIRDTGIGLDPACFDEVFIPFVADPRHTMYDKLDIMLNPEDKHIVGTGSGLGLSIVKEIVEARDGYIYFKKPDKGWMAELEIGLP